MKQGLMPQKALAPISVKAQVPPREEGTDEDKCSNYCKKQTISHSEAEKGAVRIQVYRMVYKSRRGQCNADTTTPKNAKYFRGVSLSIKEPEESD
ncbi:hypothetical protein J6590_057085 [Homalodisca vitripennis]|nr:hypothetical protein J6590_057085 [Homalodisca vitripennis]